MMPLFLARAAFAWQPTLAAPPQTVVTVEGTTLQFFARTCGEAYLDGARAGLGPELRRLRFTHLECHGFTATTDPIRVRIDP